jgi:ABC-2 type transport system ATP-binding protein
MTGRTREEAIQRVVSLCFLEGVLHQSVDTLSKGYRHRTCFAQSIIHDPDVLVLDEPTDGLDPNQKHEVRQLIKRMGEKKAIIFSTHILEEVEAVCSRAIIIDRGSVVANGAPAELKARSENAGQVRLRISGGGADAVKTRLSALMLAGRVTVQAVGTLVTARIQPRERAVPGELARAVAEASNQAGWKLEELHTEEGRLDEVFRSITLPDTVKRAA